MPLKAGARDDGRLDCRPECATTARLTCAAMALDEFSGDVALITGGGRGIGANIARELAGEVAQEIGGPALDLDVSDQTSHTFSPGNCARARERSLAHTRRASPSRSGS
jgi:hypothetical protein